ncbi:MAG TPA: pitrilysin family protein [Rhodanobacteraceae bacterium]|nr:pitrilysin family protein [Rhodanobacteraceae bacterium]
MDKLATGFAAAALAASLGLAGCASTPGQGSVAASAPAVAPAAAASAGAPADVTRATLDNGLRVVIVRDALAPVVTTEMNYLVGSDEVAEGFPGTAHALEHMMFRGGPGLSRDQLSEIAANMGGGYNADTTESVTQYYYVVPSADIDVALHIAASRMAGVDIADAAWKKERGAIEQEVSRDLSNPTYKFLTQLRAQMFAGTPYAHTGLGTRESFDKTTGQMLRDFHDAWYAPNNAILVIAGDVDPAETLASVKKLFAPIPRQPLPARPEFNFKPVTAKTVKLPTDSPYGEVFLAYRTPGSLADNAATAMVLGNALGSQRAALFGMGADGTALFGGFGTMQLPQAGIGFAVGVFPRGGDSQKVLARMQAIMAKAAADGVDPALVAAAKRKMIAGLEFKKNSVAGLANAWSRALAFDGLHDPDDMKAAIEAVTPAMVNALARRIFDPAHAVTAVLTPQSSGKPGSSKGFGGAESFASTPSKPVPMPTWATEALGELHVPTSTLDPQSYTLDNGLRLIVQPEQISDTVEVYGAIHSNQDMQAAPGEEGVADVLEGLFKFGTTSMNRLQFQAALDAIAARESAGTRFSLAVPSAHFAEGMKLLADNELHPALPPRAFAIVQRQQAMATAGVLKSPDYLAGIGLAKALLPAHDPALRHATPKSIAGLTLEKVKAYMARVYRPDMTTIVIVGKVEPAQAREVVEQAFGAWQATGAAPQVEYPPVPANQPAQLHVPDSSAVQDSVTLAQTIDVTEDDAARYALTVGNEVLGGSLYASRLSNDLRKNGGLVYGVSSRFSLDKHRGSYRVTYGCDPDKVGKARAMVVRDLKQMQDEPVTATELTRAKGILLRRFPLGEASFAAIGGQLLELSLEGKPLDAPLIAARHYLKLDAHDVQAAFAAHIRPQAFVTSVKGPTPKG